MAPASCRPSASWTPSARPRSATSISWPWAPPTTTSPSTNHCCSPDGPSTTSSTSWAAFLSTYDDDAHARLLASTTALAGAGSPPAVTRWQALAMDADVVDLPRGFPCHVANIGIKDDTDDFVVIAADAPCPAAAVFTRSRFAGPSVTISREHVADGRLQAFAVVSKNANVANGTAGRGRRRGAGGRRSRRARRPADRRADRLDGGDRTSLPDGPRPVPPGLARAAVRGTRRRGGGPGDHDHGHRAQGGARPRWVRHGWSASPKGVGMIEPDMATLITLFVHRRRRRRPPTWTGSSGGSSTGPSTRSASTRTPRPATPPRSWPVVWPARSTTAALEAALHDVALSLTRQIARDGEGATTLIEVRVPTAPGRGPGQAGGQGHRQLAAGQDRRARSRSQLGTGGDGGREVLERHRHRPGAVVIRFGAAGGLSAAGGRRRPVRARRVHAGRRGAAST